MDLVCGWRRRGRRRCRPSAQRDRQSPGGAAEAAGAGRGGAVVGRSRHHGEAAGAAGAAGRAEGGIGVGRALAAEGRVALRRRTAPVRAAHLTRRRLAAPWLPPPRPATSQAPSRPRKPVILGGAAARWGVAQRARTARSLSASRPPPPAPPAFTRPRRRRPSPSRRLWSDGPRRGGWAGEGRVQGTDQADPLPAPAEKGSSAPARRRHSRAAGGDPQYRSSSLWVSIWRGKKVREGVGPMALLFFKRRGSQTRPSAASHTITPHRAVRGGVGHAGQHEAVGHLRVVQEGLVALVDGAGHDLARARRAGARAAGVGLGGIDGLRAAWAVGAREWVVRPRVPQCGRARPLVWTTAAGHRTPAPPHPPTTNSPPALTHQVNAGLLSGVEDVGVVCGRGGG